MCLSPMIVDPASRLLLLACYLWWYHSSSSSSSSSSTRTPFTTTTSADSCKSLSFFSGKWAQKSLVWKALQWKCCIFSSRQRISLTLAHTHTYMHTEVLRQNMILSHIGRGWLTISYQERSALSVESANKIKSGHCRRVDGNHTLHRARLVSSCSNTHPARRGG